MMMSQPDSRFSITAIHISRFFDVYKNQLHLNNRSDTIS